MQERLRELKLSSGCTDCGYASHPEALEFDHLDSGTKVASIARMVAMGWSWGRLLAEIAKCEVVCANCHRIRTDRRRRAQQLQAT